MICICSRMSWISWYTITRCSGVTYSNCCSSSHRLNTRICSSSRSSNTAKVLSWNARAAVVQITRAMKMRNSIMYLNYSVGYSPSVLRIIRRASSRYSSHFSTLRCTFCSTALARHCWLSANSGASPRLPSMFW